MSAYATIDDLRSQLGARPKASESSAYAERMLHQVPDAPIVDRETFIVDYCRGKRVLEFGASGKLHDAIVRVAASVTGVDRVDADGVIGFDLDDVQAQALPVCEADVVVCGEVIEHLSNPGWFLRRLRQQYGHVRTIITVPNAFSSISAKQLQRGIENVNADHVAWYSYRTLKTLLGRAGYTDFWFGWYHGHPLTAEGLVLLLEGSR